MNQQEYIKQLRDALQALVDVQDGTPFHKYEREWKAAMAEAERLLAIEPPAAKPDDCGVFTGYCAYAEKNYLPK